jgi:hypothetical protein
MTQTVEFTSRIHMYKDKKKMPRPYVFLPEGIADEGVLITGNYKLLRYIEE